MTVVGRLKDGCRSGAGSAWTATRRITVKLAVAAAIVVVVMALVDRGDDSAAGPPGHQGAPTEARPASAQTAVLTAERADEQLMDCKYQVRATFGVSIFTETSMSSKRLVRLYNGTELYGSCSSTEGGKALGCSGLQWETEWVRVQSGTAIGWSPTSCLEQIGRL